MKLVLWMLSLFYFYYLKNCYHLFFVKKQEKIALSHLICSSIILMLLLHFGCLGFLRIPAIFAIILIFLSNTHIVMGIVGFIWIWKKEIKEKSYELQNGNHSETFF